MSTPEFKDLFNKDVLKDFVKKRTKEAFTEVDKELKKFVDFFESEGKCHRGEKVFGCYRRDVIAFTELLIGKKLPMPQDYNGACIKNGETGKKLYLVTKSKHYIDHPTDILTVLDASGNERELKKTPTPATDEEIDKFFEDFKITKEVVRSIFNF